MELSTPGIYSVNLTPPTGSQLSRLEVKAEYLHDLFEEVDSEVVMITSPGIILADSLKLTNDLGFAIRIDIPSPLVEYLRRERGGFYPYPDVVVINRTWWDENKEFLPNTHLSSPAWAKAIMDRMGDKNLGGIAYRVTTPPVDMTGDPGYQWNRDQNDRYFSGLIKKEVTRVERGPFPPVQVSPFRGQLNSTFLRARSLFSSPLDITPQGRTGLPKIILALQYWDGDRDQAHLLMELLSKVERKKRDDVVFLVSFRYDAQPPDDAAISALQEKFSSVLVRRGNRMGDGHPNGCNALWLDTMMHAATIGTQRRITGVLTFEADVVPISRDWIDGVRREWKACESVGKQVTGHLHRPHPGVPEHINGNALFSTQLMRVMPSITAIPHNVAWDLHLAKDFQRIWKASNFIHNYYRKETATPEEILKWMGNGHVLIHGVRDSSARDFIGGLI